MKIYRLRIQLQDVDPAACRSVRVPAAIGLAKLHKVFQVVMGWNDSHLHEFRIGAACYGVPDPDFQEDRPVISDKRAVLDQVLKPSISQFSYLYDFGETVMSVSICFRVDTCRLVERRSWARGGSPGPLVLLALR